MKGPSGILWILLGAAFLYGAVFTIGYLGDPLAGAPQLDARENHVLAEQIREGSLPKEPFYRAMLYPWLLSQLPGGGLPQLGLLLGFACHLLNGWLIYRLAGRLWTRPEAPVLTCLLYFLNPASLFYSLQLMDITLGLSFLLGGLVIGLHRPLTLVRALSCGLLLGLAVLTRPHFLPLALLCPVWLWLADGNRKALALAGVLPVLILLLGQGLLNQARSGEFRMLPWQGSYNLWAANRPGANGLYFKQVLDLSGSGPAENPARAESVLLYGQAHPGEDPPYSIEAMNAHWKGKLLDRLATEPLDLARLWIFKAYAVANSFEPYNNLTFSFHRQRLPLLRFNPLNWGLLFVLGSLGLVQAFRTRPRLAAGWLIAALAYASMLVLFYASARFRLPLVPVLAILAGGIPGLVREIRMEPRRLAWMVPVLMGTGLLTFSGFGGIRNTDTYVQDRLLMANANADLGRDAEAARWVRQVLSAHPQRREALRIYGVSYFNLAVTDPGALSAFGGWAEQQTLLEDWRPADAVAAAVYGVFLWQWGQRDRARGLWERLLSSGEASLAGPLLEAARHRAPSTDVLVNSLQNLLHGRGTPPAEGSAS